MAQTVDSVNRTSDDDSQTLTHFTFMLRRLHLSPSTPHRISYTLFPIFAAIHCTKCMCLFIVCYFAFSLDTKTIAEKKYTNEWMTERGKGGESDEEKKTEQKQREKKTLCETNSEQFVLYEEMSSQIHCLWNKYSDDGRIEQSGGTRLMVCLSSSVNILTPIGTYDYNAYVALLNLTSINRILNFLFWILHPNWFVMPHYSIEKRLFAERVSVRTHYAFQTKLFMNRKFDVFLFLLSIDWIYCDSELCESWKMKWWKHYCDHNKI